MKDLLQAIVKYIETKAEIEKAESNCEHSRGYHLYDYYETRDNAVKECADAFDKAVGAAIKRAKGE